MSVRQVLIASFLTFSLAACGSKVSSPSADSLEKSLNQGKSLAELGPVSIHEGYLELLSRVNPNISAQLKNPAGKKRLIDSLLEQELLYQASLNKGIPKDPQVQEKAALYQRVIFAQAILDDAVEKKAKEYYDANKDKEFSRVKVAHILFKTSPPPMPPPEKGKPTPPAPDPKALEAAALKKAQEAEAKLKSGTPWEDVVKEYSDDKISQMRGGELGMISREDRCSDRLGWNDLIEKSFSMKVGEVSDPIAAKDGYHIIKVLEASSIAPYEEVQNTIKFKLRSQVKNELMADLTKGKTTEYKDEELKALAASPASAIPGMEGMNLQEAPKPGAAPNTAPGSVITVKPATESQPSAKKP